MCRRNQTIIDLEGGGNQNSSFVSSEKPFDPDTASWSADGKTTENGLEYQLWKSSGHFRAEVVGCPGIDDYNITVPETVKSKYTVYQIGERAFDGARIKTINLPSSVTSIYRYAFNKCENLTSIDLSHVRSLWDDAFWGCKSLESVTLKSDLVGIPRFCFASCHSLKTISIPSTVKRIGEQAFGSCTSLERITLPQGIEKIDSGVFYYCSSLKSISIPSSVTELGASAFAACASLTEIDIPTSVTAIGESCFGFNEGMTSLFIPSSVKKMGKGLFDGKLSATEVYCESSEIPYNWESTWASNVNGGKINVHWGSSKSTYTSAKKTYSYPWKGKAYSENGSFTQTDFWVRFDPLEWRVTLCCMGSKAEGHLYGYDPNKNSVITKWSVSSYFDDLELIYDTKADSFKTSTNGTSSFSGVTLSR